METMTLLSQLRYPKNREVVKMNRAVAITKPTISNSMI